MLSKNEIMNMEAVFNTSINSTKVDNNNLNDFAFFLEMLSKVNKFYLHAGETIYFPNYPVNREFLKKFYINDNLIHSTLLPVVELVGYCFTVGSNDLIMNIYRRKNISLKISPFSNQALNY